MDPLRTLIRRFDRFLSRCYGVQEFCADPECLLRIAAGQTSHRIDLPGGKIPRGTKAVMLHLWNERMPPLPAAGADLAYARALNRGQIYSLRLVAHYIQSAPEFADAKVVGGVTILAPAGIPDGGTAMLKHFGFTMMPYHSPLGRFGEFWENLFTWSLMWTYNPASMKHRSLWGLRRSEFWMPLGEFLDKYGKTKGDSH